MMMFDLRHFKEVNDQYGHTKGDNVLRLAANNLRKTLRASDYAFRIGGDEFALILPQTNPNRPPRSAAAFAQTSKQKWPRCK